MSKTLGTAQKTRLLLALWTLSGEQAGISVGRGSLPDWTKKKAAKEYDELLSDLESVGGITREKKRYEKITLQDKGVKLLIDGLQQPDFTFDSQIGAKTAKALVHLLCQNKGMTTPTETNGKAAKSIDSYEEFKTVTLEVFDRLNRDFNMDNLVPIYRIRREIGGRVERSEFSEWLLKMQSDDIVQLQGGSVEDSALDKIEDSITTEISGLRCYIQRL